MKSRISKSLALATLALAFFAAIGPAALAATFTGTTTVQTNFNYSGTVGLQNVTAPFQSTYNAAFTTGTGTGQANALYTYNGSLSTSSSVSLDLAGGIVDAFGTSLTCLTVKHVSIESTATNTVDLTIGNGATPFVGWFSAGTVTETVRPGGVVVHTAPQTGWTVTGATADILKIANGAAAATFKLVIVCTV